MSVAPDTATESAADSDWEYAPLRIPAEVTRVNAAVQLSLHAEFGGWELQRVVKYMDGSRRITLRRKRRAGAIPLPKLSLQVTDPELDAFADWERTSWEQRAPAYAASLGDLTRGSIDALLDAAAVLAGTRVLDVGTGPGFVALAAVGRGADVTAADQSAQMVGIASRAGLRVEHCPADVLPFADAAFDAVVAGYLLNHLARPGDAVAEFARVLRPGGRLAMTVWDVPARNAAIGSVGAVVSDAGLTAAVPAGPDSTRFADEAQVRALLAGWDDVTVTRLGWTITVEPGAWFDALADATPRTGAVLAQADPAARAALRERYVAGTVPGGTVELAAAAVLIGARTP